MISFKDVFPSKLCEDGFLYSLLNMLKRVGAKNVDFDTMYHPSNADRDKVVISASLSDDSVEDVVKLEASSDIITSYVRTVHSDQSDFSKSEKCNPSVA